MVSFQWWSDLLTGWILCGTTLLLFVFPASVTVLCLFLLSSIYHWSTLLPLVPNHVFFEMIVHLTLLAAVLVCLSKRFYEAKSIGQEKGVFSAKVFSLVRPFVITELILLYLFTVVHKLNTDFFNPAVSCAVSMHHEVAQLFPGVPEGAWTWWPTIIGTIVIELAIPLLFVSRRTRQIGVLLGLGFHLFLALHPHGGIYSFTGLLFTLYYLFLPERAASWLLTSLGRIPLLFRMLGKASILSGFAVAIYLQLEAARDLQPFEYLNSIGFAFWLPVAMTVALSYLIAVLMSKSLWSGRAGDLDECKSISDLSGFRGKACLWLFPALVFINGCCPYLGLKTTTAFAMFSNLRTEGGQSNHFFIGDMAIVGFQKDLVQVLDSNDLNFQELVLSGDLIPWFEFRRMASTSENEDAEITILRNGSLFQLTRGGSSAISREAFTPHPWWMTKFLHFRSISPFGQPMKCCW